MVCNIKLLIGMAGTGKTYKLVKLYKMCKLEKLFLTYTNENASRLCETYGVKCETIHSHFKLNYIKKDYKAQTTVENVFVDEIGIIPYDIINFLISTSYNIVGTVDYLQLLPVKTEKHNLNFSLRVEGDLFVVQQALHHVERLNIFKLTKAETIFLTENKRFKDNKRLTYDDYEKNFISINNTAEFKYPILISKYKDVNLFKNVSALRDLSECVYTHNSGIKFLKPGETFRYETVNNLIKIIYSNNVNYLSKDDFDKAKFTPCNLKIIHTTQGFEFNEGSIYLDSLFLPEMLYTAITRFKNRDKIKFIYKDINKAKKIFKQQIKIFNGVKKIVESII